MTDLVGRLRDAAGKNYDPLGHEAADEIEKLRGIVRDVMSELLIVQEDEQMSSAAYRGEWLGELIKTCQRGLSVPQGETP
jgi:hypothetical protein